MTFATINDLEILWRRFDAEELPKVEMLLELVSDSICFEAAKVGKDVVNLMETDWKSVAKIVTVAVVKRYMNETDESTQMSQQTESAIGYSLSSTYVLGGGGIKLLNNELKQLGFRTQRIGVIHL